MRQITPLLASLAATAWASTAWAAGVPLPAGPCPFDPGFGNNVTYSRTLHVATTGSDSSGNGSSGSPYATVGKALGVATAGTEIIVHQGTYTNYVSATNKQANAAAPILVAGAVGEGPVYLDRLNAGSEVMKLTDCAYLIFENMTFRNATGNGINTDDGGSYDTPSHHIIFRNLTVQDIGDGGNCDGIKLSGVDNVYVLGCLITHIRSGSGIDMVGCHDSVIAYNEFNDMGSNGTQTKGGSRNVLILGNLFVSGGERAMNMGGSTGLQYFRPLDATYEAKDIRAIGNVIKDTQAPVAYVGLVDGVAANNTIYMPSWYVVRILQETTSKDACQNGRFINNIIYFRTTDLNSAVNVGSNTLPATFTFANNLWYAVNNPSFGGYNLSPVPPEVNGIHRQDPLFTSLGDAPGTQVNDDFRLGRPSPARAWGQSIAGLEAAGSPAADRDARRYLAAPTLGAYEIGLDGDVDGDARVTVMDLLSLVNCFGAAQGTASYNFWADFSRNGLIDMTDLLTLVSHYGNADSGS
jgi:hypothetical protein